RPLDPSRRTGRRPGTSRSPPESPSPDRLSLHPRATRGRLDGSGRRDRVGWSILDPAAHRLLPAPGDMVPETPPSDECPDRRRSRPRSTGEETGRSLGDRTVGIAALPAGHGIRNTRPRESETSPNPARRQAGPGAHVPRGSPLSVASPAP